MKLRLEILKGIDAASKPDVGQAVRPVGAARSLRDK
jgi:hypothetical protein